MRLFSLLVILAAGAAGCDSSPSPQVSEPQPSAEPVSAAKRYGQPIAPGPATQLASLMKAPESFKDRAVIVEGAVRQACTRKGCWMEVAESMDKTRPGCRVTFKDYGFFVPTDSAGAKARVQGNVVVQTVEAKWVEHMEEEGAHFASKNADGSANEVRLVATGVELVK
jgi:hypothetical protein